MKMELSHHCRSLAPVFSSSESTQRHSVPGKTNLGIKLKTFVKAIHALQECLNPLFFGSVLPNLIFNQFTWVVCITMQLHVKERDTIRKRDLSMA